jgi:hypothetical protein
MCNEKAGICANICLPEISKLTRVEAGKLSTKLQNKTMKKKKSSPIMGRD